MNLLVKSYKFILTRLKKSIRLEIMVTFAICIVISMTVGGVTYHLLRAGSGSLRPPHSMMQRLNEPAMSLANNLEQQNYSIKDQAQIEQLLERLQTKHGYEIMISDTTGRVIYHTDNTTATQVDIEGMIKSSLKASMGEKLYFNRVKDQKQYTSFYPVEFTDGKGYIVVNNQLDMTLMFGDEAILNPELVGSIITLGIFLGTFILLTNRKMKYIEYVSAGLLEISKGNLDYKLTKQGEDELALLANNINIMAEKLKMQIESERNAEKIKNELITNVSHDLRTPLTSIKGYLEVIRGRKNYDQRQIEQFINIVYNKSEKLEKLVNDLFEYTKLVNKAVSIDWERLDLNELLAQLIDEFVPTCAEHNVTIMKEFPQAKIMLDLDPDKTVRIFENLFINAIKYSVKPSQIHVELSQEGDWAVVRVQNQCENIDTQELGRIFDRFYRIDQSRSSDRGGSGLGLAIAKNLVELQGGIIDVEYEANIINFIVKFSTQAIKA